MRQLFLFAFFAIIFFQASSQVNMSGDIEVGFRDMVQQTRTVLKAKQLTDFTDLGGEKRFVSSEWLKGTVRSIYGPISNKNYRYNYDFLDKQLYALFNDTVIAVEVNYIVSFYLEKDGQSRYYTRLPELDKDNFVESLYYDSTKKAPVQLLRHRSVTLVKGDKNSYLANQTGEYSDNIKTKTEYYLYFPDGKFTKVKLDKKSFNAVLQGRNKQTDEFLQNTKVINEGNIALLLEVLNA